MVSKPSNKMEAKIYERPRSIGATILFSYWIRCTGPSSNVCWGSSMVSLMNSM